MIDEARSPGPNPPFPKPSRGWAFVFTLPGRCPRLQVGDGTVGPLEVFKEVEEHLPHGGHLVEPHRPVRRLLPDEPVTVQDLDVPVDGLPVDAEFLSEL